MQNNRRQRRWACNIVAGLSVPTFSLAVVLNIAVFAAPSPEHSLVAESIAGIANDAASNSAQALRAFRAPSVLLADTSGSLAKRCFSTSALNASA